MGCALEICVDIVQGRRDFHLSICGEVVAIKTFEIERLIRCSVGIDGAMVQVEESEEELAYGHGCLCHAVLECKPKVHCPGSLLIDAAKTVAIFPQTILRGLTFVSRQGIDYEVNTLTAVCTDLVVAETLSA
jgi:hypothetical protein